jgi:hypothetical protein
MVYTHKKGTRKRKERGEIILFGTRRGSGRGRKKIEIVVFVMERKGDRAEGSHHWRVKIGDNHSLTRISKSLFRYGEIVNPGRRNPLAECGISQCVLTTSPLPLEFDDLPCGIELSSRIGK